LTLGSAAGRFSRPEDASLRLDNLLFAENESRWPLAVTAFRTAAQEHAIVTQLIEGQQPARLQMLVLLPCHYPALCSLF
jgi:hypothetical protein